MIGTLGNKMYPSTCSYAAVAHHFFNRNILLFSTFEECMTALKERSINIGVVPAAYPKINPIIMDDDLQVADTFMYRIPDLVLAANQENNIRHFHHLYFHPATKSLFSKINSQFSFKEIIPADSNTDAALKVKQSGRENNLCITNALCVAQQDLKALQILKEGFVMPFICFTRKGFSPK
ncbi:prephenate dehydratase domain-containing protein [Neisseria sp. 83E34]|uniref:prephenate dehydratase domain-containing protein n=1 Tax=Neisseria sp. 83E34 TaxID=1692264 RepID=UPI0006CE8910|nr:prephenate dehydratase domain-containing protein [Neisseria sp. 83E34]KPN71115.1 hypothetical protein AKG09_08100 [Neisseria sp. 83E34]